jgi:hypothetical protein
LKYSLQPSRYAFSSPATADRLRPLPSGSPCLSARLLSSPGGLLRSRSPRGLHPCPQTAARAVRPTSGALPPRDSRPFRSPSRSALHRLSTANTASADFSLHRLPRRRPFRHQARSPQIRTSASPAQPPDLRRLPSVTGASQSFARSPREAPPLIRFLFVGSQVSLRASFRRSLALPPLRFRSGRRDRLPAELPPAG